MPAAAVIPALQINRFIAAVKKLVVGFVLLDPVHFRVRTGLRSLIGAFPAVAFTGSRRWVPSLL